MLEGARVRVILSTPSLPPGLDVKGGWVIGDLVIPGPFPY